VTNHTNPADGKSDIDPTDPFATPSTGGRRSTRSIVAAATAGVLAVGGLGAVALWHGGSTTKAPAATASRKVAGRATTSRKVAGRATTSRKVAGRATTHAARLAASSCSGPKGAAYVVDAGWDGFTAINTANCSVITTYNVDDPDYNYSSASESVDLVGSELYFADTGTNSVAVIDAATLDPTNYNPTEKLINVGTDPQDLTVTPNGKQLWVANTGPQTDPSWHSGVTVISTATDKKLGTIQLAGGPTHVAAAPNSKEVYVTTSKGLYVYKTATRKLAWKLLGLGNPETATVAPNGKDVYVTESSRNEVAVVSTSTGKVVKTIKVGQLPWQIVFNAKGTRAYVSNPNSDTVSVINPVKGAVTKTFHIKGDPTSLGLTPDGSELWVGQDALGNVAVVNAKTGASDGTVYLGGGPQEGDGYDPTGIAMSTTTPNS
jgi:YVTN family beta-propeller protein